MTALHCSLSVYLQAKAYDEWAKRLIQSDPNEIDSPITKMLGAAAIYDEKNNKPTNFTIDTQSDYFSSADVRRCNDLYGWFYDENREELITRYKQLQNDMTWSDEFYQFGSTILASILYIGLYTSVQTCFVESLKAHRVSENMAQWLVFAASLSLMTLTNTSWYPLIFAGVTLIVFKTLNDLKLLSTSDPTQRFLSNLASTLTTIAQNYSFDAWGIFNVTSSLLVSLPAVKISGEVTSYLTQSFWRWQQGNPDKAAPALSASDLKLHRA